MLKRGKDAESAQTYRPICIQNASVRLMMSFVATQISGLWTPSPCQMGFVAGKSKQLATALLEYTITTRSEKNLMTLVAFVDLSNAYDRVKTEILRRKLEEGMASTEWIHVLSWFLKIPVRAKWWEKRIGWEDNGLKQGDPLSPILFNIYIADLWYNVNNAAVQDREGFVKIGASKDGQDVYNNIVMYADDICLVAPGKQEMNEMLQRMEKYAAENSMIISPKTQLMAFGKSSTRLMKDKSIRSYQFVDEYKYLGLKFARNGSGRLNLDSMAHDLLYRMSGVAGLVLKTSVRFRLSPNQFRILLRGYVEWVFNQAAGIPIWNERTMSQAQVIYATTCRRAVGLLQASPVAVVFHTLGLMDVESLVYLANSKMIQKWQELKWMEMTQYLIKRQNEIKMDLNMFQSGRELELVNDHMQRWIHQRVQASSGSLTYFGTVFAKYPWRCKIQEFMKRKGWKDELKKRAGVDSQPWYTAWAQTHFAHHSVRRKA